MSSGYALNGYVVCCVGDFKGKAVHTFVMCAHFPDVRTLRSMLHCCCIVDDWLYLFYTSTNHCSIKVAPTQHTTYVITKVPLEKL